MEYNVALLVFGIILLLVGLVGKVKAKEIEVGTSNSVTRFLVGLIGAGLITLSLLLSPAFDLLSRLGFDTAEPATGTETDAGDSTDEPAEAPVLEARIAVVAANARLGETIAAEIGPWTAALELVSHDELQQLGVYGPDLIIVAADTGNVWPEMSPGVLRRLFAGKKIVGLGTGGATLFQRLGSTIGLGHGMHAPGQHHVVLANFPSGHVDRPDLPPEFLVHLPGRTDVHAIHDGGSPAFRGFEAFAHLPSSDHHWPVLRQGNLLLWGFDAPLDTLTGEGRTLLRALMQDHLLRPHDSFEESLPRVETTPPGRHNERLTEQFPSQEWHIRLMHPGHIHASVEFDPELAPLALILNGPGQIGYFARRDGSSPLEIEFEVTPELLEQGDIWRVSVKKFGAVPRPVDYTIALDFPG